MGAFTRLCTVGHWDVARRKAQNEVDRLHPGRNSLIPRNQGLGSCGLGSRSMDRFSGGGDRASSIIVPG